jgi:beta-lactamase class A
MTIVRIASVLALLNASGQGGITPSVQQQIVDIVARFKGILGVAAIDLRSGETVAVNADTRFPTASTIKTAVMIEVYQQAAEGRLPLSTVITLKESDKVGGSGVLNGMHEGMSLTVADLIHLMIVLSDNTATNLLIERIGAASVNARLDSYGLHDIRLFRPTFRDGKADVLPDLEREYGLGMTTPREMAKLMAMIADGKAVSVSASEAMLATLQRQQDRAMIPRLISVGRGLTIGNKTGTDEEKHAGSNGVRRHVRADAAIVTGPDIRYVVAIYARHVEDTRWSVDNDAVTTAARVSLLLHNSFTGK